MLIKCVIKIHILSTPRHAPAFMIITFAKKIVMKIKFLIGLLFPSMLAMGQKPEIFSTKEGAVGGMDVVAYFEVGKPVKGSASFTYTWRDAEWRFSSQENLNAFMTDPIKFAPQYGGYCAYGMSKGYKAPTEFNAWAIVDDKLYFNYNLKVKQTWDENRKTFILKANENWPKIKDED